MYMRAKRHVVILGGGYAGLIAAARAARAGDGVEVTLLNAGGYFVQRIRMHELLAGGQPRTAPIAPLLHRRDVHFVEGYVYHVDPERQRIEGRTSTGNAWERGYDELVVALGSHTAVPGVAEHALRLNDPSAIQEAAAQLRHIANRNGRVLVVGGGLTAIETATELAARWPGLRVSLSTSGRLGSAFAPAATARL